MRTIGIHLRVYKSLEYVQKRANNLGLDSFQCFLIEQESGKNLQINDQQIAAFYKVIRSFKGPLFLHGSYMINLAHGSRDKHPLLGRELYLARRLGFDYIILHPGIARDVQNREEAIRSLAVSLNLVLKKNPRVKVVLENIASNGLLIGADLQDFADLLTLIEHPDRLLFCIDTCHAHAYGYNLQTNEGRNEFISLLDKVMGIDRIALIHLNDSIGERGSGIDRHSILGEGTIGLDALRSFVLDPRLVHIPLILELPETSEACESEAIAMVRGWHT